MGRGVAAASANLRINRPVGFLPYFFKPAFQFVTTVMNSV
jgi:hypothetical protein